MFQYGHIEVDQQTNSHTRQTQIGKKLRFVNGEHGLHRFQLDNNFLIDDEVDAISTVKLHIFVGHGQFDLLPESKAAELKFTT